MKLSRTESLTSTKWIKDVSGETLVIIPVEVRTFSSEQYGDQEGVVCAIGHTNGKTVTDLSTLTITQSCKKSLINALHASADTPVVVGTVGHAISKSGRKCWSIDTRSIAPEIADEFVEQFCAITEELGVNAPAELLDETVQAKFASLLHG